MSTTPPPIPDTVRRFVLAVVPSVPFLEAACLFHSAPEATHTDATLASALYIEAGVAARLLEDLSEAGIVRRGLGGYGYSPRTPEIASDLDQVISCYRANLVGMTQLIHDSTLRNAERFANAFRWRKDSDNG